MPKAPILELAQQSLDAQQAPFKHLAFASERPLFRMCTPTRLPQSHQHTHSHGRRCQCQRELHCNHKSDSVMLAKS